MTTLIPKLWKVVISLLHKDNVQCCLFLANRHLAMDRNEQHIRSHFFQLKKL